MRNLVIGIDEAGRGPLAGPVAVGLVLASETVAKSFFKKRPLRDSKKMPEKEREQVFAEVCEAQKAGTLVWTVKFVSVSVIDRIGIAHAINRAIENGVHKLDPTSKAFLELDGALKPPLGRRKFRVTIKGDEKIAVVALASAVAKVSRDRLMKKLSKKFPKYGFEKHKGYGTAEHYRALKKFGLSVIHRRTYLKSLSKK